MILALKTPLEREFYATLCHASGWSVRGLRREIAGALFARTSLSRGLETALAREMQNFLLELGDGALAAATVAAPIASGAGAHSWTRARKRKSRKPKLLPLRAPKKRSCHSERRAPPSRAVEESDDPASAEVTMLHNVRCRAGARFLDCARRRRSPLGMTTSFFRRSKNFTAPREDAEETKQN